MLEVEHKIVNFFKSIPGIENGYVVGGAVRDMLLKRKIKDYDIIITSDRVKSIIRKFKEKDVAVFCLDQEREYYRVICELENDRIQVDIVKMTAIDIKNDLSTRDFTINSIALPMKNFLTGKIELKELIDPYGGVKDLKNNLLRPVNNNIFKEDALRVIRVFRFMSRGFVPICNLFEMMESDKHGLKNISPSRIYLELFSILEYNYGKERNSCDFILLKQIQKLKVWELILPLDIQLYLNYKDEINKLCKDELKYMENWFFCFSEIIKEEGFKEDDITFFKWLLWWSLVFVNSEEDVLKKFINSLLNYFPVQKKHKKYAGPFLQGLFIELESKSFEQAKTKLEKILVKNPPESRLEEKALVFGQVAAKKIEMTLRIKIKAPLLNDYELKLANLEYKRNCLNKIKECIDGNFVLQHFETSPGPWVSKLLNKLYLELLNQSGNATTEELKQKSRQVIEQIKESEKFGGEHYS